MAERSLQSVRLISPDATITLAGETVRLLQAGAMWLADSRVLVVSDLHLEKGSAYAARGQMTPPYDTRATLGRLEGLMEAYAPLSVVALGDSFHDRNARGRMAADDVARVRRMATTCDWVWIEGNHDPAPPADLGGRAAAELRVGGLSFRHEAAPGAAVGEVSGHYHPCARVAGRGGSVRARCFATDGERLVMPAFGALTGGLNVLDAAFAGLFPHGLKAFVMGRDGVYETAMNRLVADRAVMRGMI